MTSPKRLLAVFAHPDDETFGSGSTLARYASEGVDITVVCATRGEVGERTFQLERAFNVKQGLVPEDDYTAPKRLIEAPVDGRAKGKSIAPYLHGMVMQYYELAGWDKKTGKPWRDTLESVGLEDVAKDLWE